MCIFHRQDFNCRFLKCTFYRHHITRTFYRHDIKCTYNRLDTKCTSTTARRAEIPLFTYSIGSILNALFYRHDTKCTFYLYFKVHLLPQQILMLLMHYAYFNMLINRLSYIMVYIKPTINAMYKSIK